MIRKTLKTLFYLLTARSKERRMFMEQLYEFLG